MFTKQEYLEEYKNNNKKTNVTKLFGYIEERLDHNSSLGCSVARFENFQLSPTLWKILTNDKQFKVICKCRGYDLAFQKNEDGSWVDITSAKAKANAEIWNQLFKDNDVSYFFNVIMGRLFAVGLEKILSILIILFIKIVVVLLFGNWQTIKLFLKRLLKMDGTLIVVLNFSLIFKLRVNGK